MLTEQEKSQLLDVWDEIGLTEPHVRRVTGMSKSEITKKIKQGKFPMPVGYVNGHRCWRSGDIMRMELGWA